MMPQVQEISNSSHHYTISRRGTRLQASVRNPHATQHQDINVLSMLEAAIADRNGQGAQQYSPTPTTPTPPPRPPPGQWQQQNSGNSLALRQDNHLAKHHHNRIPHSNGNPAPLAMITGFTQNISHIRKLCCRVYDLNPPSEAW